MTILDNDRGYGRPVETLATEFRKSIPLRMLVTLAVSPARYEHTLQEASEVFADMVLPVLRKKGWLSDLGITAIEAERNAK